MYVTAIDAAMRGLIGAIWAEIMDPERLDGHGRTITWATERASGWRQRQN